MTLEERVARIEKYGSPPAQHQRRRQLGAYVLVVVIGIIGFINSQNTADDIARSQRDLQAGLIRACERNGNPLRRVVANGVRKDITQVAKQLHQARHADYQKFFPNLTPRRLAVLKRRQINRLASERKQDHAELAHLKPVDCSALYH